MPDPIGGPGTLRPLAAAALAAAAAALAACEANPAVRSDAAPEPRRQVEVGSAPTVGAAGAPVVIVEFADFECPACGAAEAALARVRVDYADRVLVAWKHFPLYFHDHAFRASEAAAAAHAQGRFWPYHDLLFANQRHLEREDLEAYAGQAGLDLDAFRAALDARTFRPVVEADIDQGEALGVPGTPTFYVNGRRLVGAAPYSVWEALIAEELARLPDAGAPDARSSDAPPPDARALDAAPPDARAPDAPSFDAAPTDAPPGDAPPAQDAPPVDATTP